MKNEDDVKIASKFWNQTSSYDVWNHTTTVITEVYIESRMPDGKEMKLFAISTFKIVDEKIISLREYWADTYPAPEWRKQWVEIC